MTENNNHLILLGLFEFGHGTIWVVVVLITIVLLFPPYVTAQTGTVLPPPPPPPPVDYRLDPKIKISPSTAIVLVCLVSAFFFMGCFSIYIRQCVERRTTHSFTLSADGVGSGRRSRRTTARGLDPAVVDTFPTFLYSDVKGLKIGKAALECAVCLNEFEDEETLRLLPKCSHVFHADCIDAWLASHITCPVCRANLVPKPGEPRPVTILTHDSDRDPFDSDRSPDTHDSVGVVDDLVVDIQSPEVINPSRTPNHNRPPRSASRKARITGKFPRSHSTGHSLVQPGEDYERFTLRLPEEVRNSLVNSSLSRTKSCVAFPRVSSSRKGYRSSSGGSGRGKNYMSYGRFDQEERSDRFGFTMTPPFFSRAGSARSQKVGVGTDLTATPKNLFKSIKSPFDRLFGGTDKDNVGERSFDRLRPDGQV